MNIIKAFCIELGRSINIVDARNAYFSQKICHDQPERKKLTFLCSSPECRSNEHAAVVIIGVNHYRVLEDNPSYRQPYFRSKDISAHSPKCHWVLEDKKQQNKIEKTQDKISKARLKKEYKDGYINHSTFLTKNSKIKASPTNQTEEKIDNLNPESISHTKKSNTQLNSNKISNRASSAIRRSSSFSKLVSDYIEIHRKKEWSTELHIEGLQATTYGEVFRFLKNFNEKYSENHIHYGGAKVSKVLPKDFEFGGNSLPNAVILKFDQEVTVGTTTGKPTLMIKRSSFEETPSAHVLAETIKKAINDPTYSDHIWCHFYGVISDKERTYIDKKLVKRNLLLPLKLNLKKWIC